MMTTHADRVGATVRAELARRRHTQQDAADVLGLSQMAVSRRLTGTVPFDAEELGRLADWLGIPVSVLFGERSA